MNIKKCKKIYYFLILIDFLVPLLDIQAKLISQKESSFTISLFEYSAPGAYRLLQIDESGMCEYIQFQRTIQLYRLGHLSSNILDSLMNFFSSESFNMLKGKYDVYPLDKTLPPVIYEDTYYQLTIRKAGLIKTVLAHEHAAPPLLKQIVSTLILYGRNLPDKTAEGLFIIVTEPEIASKIRWLKSAKRPAVEFDNETLSQYPVLKKALLNMGWLYPILSLEAEGIQKYFVEGSTCFEIIYHKMKCTACILEGKR